jgi:hypothetical protein
MGIDPENNDILRHTALQIIHQELDLEKLVLNHPNYTNAAKAAEIVIRGIVNRGWLSRWVSAPRKKPNRVRDTTKGYLLTRTGRQQLDSVLNDEENGLQHLVKRMFRPDLIVIQQNIDIGDEEDDDTTSTEPLGKTLPVEELVPLVKEFETRQKAIEEYDAIIQDYSNSEKELNSSFQNLNDKLSKLYADQAELKKQLDNLKNKRNKLNEDLQSAKDLREEECERYQFIKTKLGSAFDK